jgi:hypothetical protein
MYKFNLIIVFYCVFTHNIQAQFDPQVFLYRVNIYYYNLHVANLGNFSSWITSDEFERNTEKIFQKEVFPLEIIWTKSNRVFFIKRSLPALNDSTEYIYIEKLQLDLLNELKDIIRDWQRFHGGMLLENMPQDYLLQANNDTVYLRYETRTDSGNSTAVIDFTVKGKCLKINTTYHDKDKNIIFYPSYSSYENKWLNTGWIEKIFESGKITHECDIKVLSQKVGNYLLPDKISMDKKTLGPRGQDKKFSRIYKFRNILTNKNLKVIN